MGRIVSQSGRSKPTGGGEKAIFLSLGSKVDKIHSVEDMFAASLVGPGILTTAL